MEEEYLLFENYLAEELSDKERINFEDKIKSDKDFKISFSLYKETSRFLDNKFKNEANRIAFKKNLEKISDNYFEKNVSIKKTSRFKPWHYSIAASLLLIFSVYFYQNTKTPTYNDFANYNAIELATRSNQDHLIIEAEKAFNTKNFDIANSIFTQLLEKDENNTEIKLYNAFSLIELNNFTEADAVLKEISNGESTYREKAKWYLALSKLKQKEYDSCKVILETIPASANEYSDAQKLLSKLE